MRPLLAAIALIAADQPPRACLTAPEAQAVALVALPEILRQTGVACASALAADSPLRQPHGAFVARYDAAADQAWPAAQAALVKLSDPQASALLGSQFARGLLTTLVTPLIVGRIATKDCGTVDRLVTALSPLPPRNTADVVVTALRYISAQKSSAGARNPVAALPLCP